MKKTYNKPELTVHGSVEEVTQVSAKDLKKVGDFITAFGKGVNLSAVLS